MKATIRILSLALALLMIVFCLAACNDTPAGGTNDGGASNDGGNGGEATPSLWDSATYKESKSFGEGDYTLTVTMEMENKSIVFTIKTNAATVKDALAEHNLIDGEQQSAGYMMSHLNGVRADWTLDGAYWAFYQNGEYMMTGIDTTPITGDGAYEFVYTRAS